MPTRATAPPRNASTSRQVPRTILAPLGPRRGQLAPQDGLAGLQPRQDPAGNPGRHGKADSGHLARDRSIDAHDPALRVQQRAARGTRLQAGIRLDEVDLVGDRQAAVEDADDASRDRALEPEGMPDRQNRIAHGQAIIIRENQSPGCRPALHDDQRQVRGPVKAHDAARGHLPVVRPRPQAQGILNHVGAGHDHAIGTHPETCAPPGPAARFPGHRRQETLKRTGGSVLGLDGHHLASGGLEPVRSLGCIRHQQRPRHPRKGPGNNQPDDPDRQACLAHVPGRAACSPRGLPTKTEDHRSPPGPGDRTGNPRHPFASTYRCSLPGLAGLAAERRAGPSGPGSRGTLSYAMHA